MLLTGNERLDDGGRNRMLLSLRVGDPREEVAGAWLAKESVRDVYLADTTADAAVLLDKAIAGCLADEVPEIVTLGQTLRGGGQRSSPATTPAPPTAPPRASTCA